MKEFEIVDQLDTEKKEYDRSLYLTLLCIASFVGSWITILFYTLYINKVSDIERSVYHLDEGGMLEYSLMKLSIVMALVSFIGAVFMWRMRKFGLIIYAVGQVVPAVMIVYITLLINPVEYPKTFAMFGFAGIHILFIGLYLISWRTMRW